MPLLVSPIEGEILFIYLAVMEDVVSSLLCSFQNEKNDAYLFCELCTSGGRSSI